MTVIAVRNNIMAVDSQASDGGLNYAEVEKMRRLPDGSIVGIAGDLMNGTRLLDLMVATNGEVCHKDLTGFYDVSALHLRADGCWLITGDKKNGGRALLRGKFWAEGSGYVAALAAMHMGATAKEAVEVACKLVSGCSPPCHTLKLTGRYTKP